MAPNSPHSRIDQFYSSRKRKATPPGLKSEKIRIHDCSGAEVTLKNCLTNSSCSVNAIRTSSAGPNILSEHDYVKRDRVSLVEVHVQKGNSIVAKQKDMFECSSNTGNIAVDCIHKSCSISRDKGHNLELEQFASDFLALYCGDLQSTASSPSKAKSLGNKREKSPCMVDHEEKTSKKKLCMSSPVQSVSIGKNIEDMHSVSIAKTGTSIFHPPGQRDAGNHLPQLQSSLRKCNTLAKVVNTSEFCTPGLPTVRSMVHETPKSHRGSSLISPGDAFWSEAIQVADELFVESGNPIVRSTVDATITHSNQSKDMPDEVDGSTELIEKNVKNPVNPVSPLPVKNLDLLFDEKKLSAGAQAQCIDGNTLEGLPNGIREAQDKTPVDTADKKEPSGPQIQDVHSLPSSSPATGLGNSGSVNESNDTGTPTSFVLLNDQLDLSSLLPSDVCNVYQKRGISKLYPWQIDCLKVDGVLQKRNLVYCASTSAGKSFVAEILMLRRVVSSGKIALLVLPYVSICAEKAEHLEGLLEPLGKQVRSYYRNQGGGTLPKDTSVAVCTIEKANYLINKLLEEDRLSEIGIVVIDELHMVGDQSRGYLLELLLTKLRYASGEGRPESDSGGSSGTGSKCDPVHGMQIVGMSATMPNVTVVSDWLQAALYQTNFRPVPLEEYIKVGNTIYNKKMDIIRTLPHAADLHGKDPDHVVELCNEVVQEGHSVLIFCSSRKGCESTARHISKFLKKISASTPNDSEFADISSAIDALRKCPAGLDPTLEETFFSGVAFHHAGLTVEEREIIESCYRKGLLRVLTATSTLAAGVNLPARRVIFRQPRIGRDFIDGTRYKQMAGRAGRTGIDVKGESVVICKPHEFKRIIGLVNESCPPLESCLSKDKNGMAHAILEVVAGGLVQTASDVHRYVRCTLLNYMKPFSDVVKSAQESLRWLCHKKFLEWDKGTKVYGATPLGRAAFGSSLCPEESLIVLDDLTRAREGFILASDLHLVYLVTPVNVEVEPDWELYYERFMELSPLNQSVGNRVGVSEPFLMHMAHGVPVRTSAASSDNAKAQCIKMGFRNQTTLSSMGSDNNILRVCKRFFVALMLSRLVQEAAVGEVCESFRVARGMVQALQENAGRFASMVALFCERLGWHDLEGLVAKFQNRVSFGVRAEIAELTNIPFVKGSRARALYNAGLHTYIAIAEASLHEIVKALFESSSWSAQEGGAQKRMQLGIAKKIKNGARKIVLDKAEEARIAAFSAFKSLGLNVPQITCPLRSNTSGDVIENGIATASSGDVIENRIVTASSGDDVHMKQIDIASSILPTHSDNKAEVQQVVAHVSKLDNSSDNKRDSGLVPMGLDQHDYSMKNCKQQCSEEKLSDMCNGANCDKGPVSVRNTFMSLDCFLDILENIKEFYFDLHYKKLPEKNGIASFEIQGIAVCWEGSPVYYVNFLKDLLHFENERHKNLSSSTVCESRIIVPPENWLNMVAQRWKRIGEILGKRDVRKITWNLKVQMHALKVAVVSIKSFGCLITSDKTPGIQLNSSLLPLSPITIQGGIDMCIVAWILWPDEGRNSNPSLEKEVKRRLSRELIAAANRSGKWKNQMRRAAHNGCCRRVAQARALHSVLWKLIISEGLSETLISIEMPLVNVLADMDHWGIGVDMEACLQARTVLGRRLRNLEAKAQELVGMKFSLCNTAEIANVLFERLKLPIPDSCNKGKQHPSTNKQCLTLLSHKHPVVPVIREHRTLAKLLNCTLGSACSLARLSTGTQKYTLHGHWLQTSTATGRLSMEEPNLQCVEHVVDCKLSADGSNCKINARNFFVPSQENWLIVAADYSQIELRLMAHFSKDARLIELLSQPTGDIFTMIAARWMGKPEETIDSVERDQTKKLVYGFLYGMGSKALAEQLGCTSDEAAEKIKVFKNDFPGVASWLHLAVLSCHDKGYVETLKGRKRFLSKIKVGNEIEKAKARRQAVNSICQGSAADIIKIAMLNIYSVIVNGASWSDCSSSIASKFQVLNGKCRILLQVHDELLLEVEPSLVREAALLLQTSMEGAAQLLDDVVQNMLAWIEQPEWPKKRRMQKLAYFDDWQSFM